MFLKLKIISHSYLDQLLEHWLSWEMSQVWGLLWWCYHPEQHQQYPPHQPQHHTRAPAQWELWSWDSRPAHHRGSDPVSWCNIQHTPHIYSVIIITILMILYHSNLCLLYKLNAMKTGSIPGISVTTVILCEIFFMCEIFSVVMYCNMLTRLWLESREWWMCFHGYNEVVGGINNKGRYDISDNYCYDKQMLVLNTFRITSLWILKQWN